MRFHLILVSGFAACGGNGHAVGPGDAALDATADATADAAVDAAPDAGTCATQPALTALAPTASDEVVIVGDTGSTLGVFDPSLVYPDGAPGGAMAYSSVPDQHSIRTRIALSGDAGATWTFVAQANQPVAATLPSSDATECPGGACSGFLIDEVPSLIIDPTDPDAQARWKLFTHRYLVGADNALHYRIGTITRYTAPAPEGPWSAPQPLVGWTSPAPHSSAGVAVNVSTIPAMADCLALTEPTALWRPEGIDLALGCVYLDGGAPRIRVALLRSTDHAASFGFVATMLSASDATCASAAGNRYNAPQLFSHAGATYLVVSPAPDDGSYAGCDVFAIDDPATGAVHRIGDDPRPLRRLTVPGRFAGACTAAEGVPGGYLMSVLYPEAPPRVFRIVRTGIAAP
ncbi:MAG: hypothetical protein K8W52_16290 [Deltaproteobacteria bacterium]|nr:hypothetical protein [Deltaproteobacteria bacterium]